MDAAEKCMTEYLADICIVSAEIFTGSPVCEVALKYTELCS